MSEPEFDRDKLRKCMIACPISAAIIMTIVAVGNLLGAIFSSTFRGR